MQAEIVPIDSIYPNPNNPRIIKDKNFKKLVQSIKDFPEMLKLRPIVVNVANTILGGNMRHEAAKVAGLKEIHIIRAEELSADQQREFIIKDNVGYGEWDWEILANDWDAVQLDMWGVEIPDFNPLGTAEDDGFEVPEGGSQTSIVPGDVFDIGPHRLICGDSTQTDTFKTLFGEGRADMVITDPPYNVDYVGKTKDALKIQNDKMSDSAFYQFLYDFYTAQGAYTKPGGAWYVWHADSEGANFRRAMADAGIMVKQCLIWIKQTMVMGRQDYQWKHEPCLYGWKEGAAHSWYNDRKQTTVLEFDRPQRSKEHPTMKPIPLFSYQIQNSSKEGDIVADCFAGSGTTMVACHQIGRVAYCVENDPRYCQVIVDRMAALDPDIQIKLNGKDYAIQVSNSEKPS